MDVDRASRRTRTQFDGWPLVFLHIRKCGGTSVGEMLRTALFEPDDPAIYPQDKPLSLITEDSLAFRAPPSSMPRKRYGRITVADGRYLPLRDKAMTYPTAPPAYEFYQGHYDHSSITTYIPGNPKIIVFLRDPFDRLISNFYYHRSFRWSWIDETSSVAMTAAKMARSMSAFLDCPSNHVRYLNDNNIVRQLCGMGAFDAQHNPIIGWDEIYDRAVAHLDAMWHVGFLECFPESARSLCRKLGIADDAVDVPFENSRRQNAGHSPLQHLYEEFFEEVRLTDEDREKMESFIRFDRRLYEHARRAFWPVDAAIPDDPAATPKKRKRRSAVAVAEK
ncbi:sulfotransferase family 2 domain-containing protein [Azospirillum sp. RWY-5-1]|uniref:Sulfotransferase family 2 domain-containing protein n=1 Tax=Azospirillum oleiclasticum TaxID=2735135 RepID=A0ABX2TF35_9PROT|nr:sulfotransferase family 2 domain-containing protein [Azospirillum oleiclasticum]NYZ15624.1 sulfotransferase family 2 domain-containing protein [Azospirillum oleiclasticum]NYZ22647.1 sulfotransferase family 2 domain-containing protein [Azospirillum oleiclasticum]